MKCFLQVLYISSVLCIHNIVYKYSKYVLDHYSQSIVSTYYTYYATAIVQTTREIFEKWII
jgi:hypothetical protein